MNAENLPVRQRQLIGFFADRVKKYCAANLVSLILYGSAARGEFVPAQSDINILVILKDARLEALKSLAKALSAARCAPFRPLVFTEEYLRRSLDVFPIEFLDMKAHHRLLHGEDILKDIDIDLKHLRFQCEQELKEKLIALKSAYLRNQRAPALRGLLIRSFTPVMYLLANVLRLRGAEHTAASTEDMIAECERALGINRQTFTGILLLKQKKHKAGGEELEALLSGFTGDIEKVIAHVDTR